MEYNRTAAVWLLLGFSFFLIVDITTALVFRVGDQKCMIYFNSLNIAGQNIVSGRIVSRYNQELGEGKHTKLEVKCQEVKSFLLIK